MLLEPAGSAHAVEFLAKTKLLKLMYLILII